MILLPSYYVLIMMFVLMILVIFGSVAQYVFFLENSVQKLKKENKKLSSQRPPAPAPAPAPTAPVSPVAPAPTAAPPTVHINLDTAQLLAALRAIPAVHPVAPVAPTVAA